MIYRENDTKGYFKLSIWTIDMLMKGVSAHSLETFKSVWNEREYLDILENVDTFYLAVNLTHLKIALFLESLLNLSYQSVSIAERLVTEYSR